MIVLNLGCGTKTSNHRNVVNIDKSAYFRIRNKAYLRLLAPLIVGKARVARYMSLPSNSICHDLSRGIPFADGYADAAYCSHFLEHLDRECVPGFLKEVRRVLRMDGLFRIVVPDFEKICRRYIVHVDDCRSGSGSIGEHDNFIADLLEQSVRKSPYSSMTHTLRSRVEDVLLGDARQRGETHQWAYDRYNLTYLLSEAGFRDCKCLSYSQSQIESWSEYKLDVDNSGGEYKKDSLYIESCK